MSHKMLRPILASTLSLDWFWIVQNTRRTWNIEQLFNPIPFHTTGFHIRRIFVFHIFTSIFQSKREYYRALFTIKRSLQPSIVNDSQNATTTSYHSLHYQTLNNYWILTFHTHQFSLRRIFFFHIFTSIFYTRENIIPPFIH